MEGAGRCGRGRAGVSADWSMLLGWRRECRAGVKWAGLGECGWHVPGCG